MSDKAGKLSPVADSAIRDSFILTGTTKAQCRLCRAVLRGDISDDRLSKHITSVPCLAVVQAKKDLKPMKVPARVENLDQNPPPAASPATTRPTADKESSWKAPTAVNVNYVLRRRSAVGTREHFHMLNEKRVECKHCGKGLSNETKTLTYHMAACPSLPDELRKLLDAEEMHAAAVGKGMYGSNPAYRHFEVLGLLRARCKRCHKVVRGYAHVLTKHLETSTCREASSTGRPRPTGGRRPAREGPDTATAATSPARADPAVLKGAAALGGLVGRSTPPRLHPVYTNFEILGPDHARCKQCKRIVTGHVASLTRHLTLPSCSKAQRSRTRSSSAVSVQSSASEDDGTRTRRRRSRKPTRFMDGIVNVDEALDQYMEEEERDQSPSPNTTGVAAATAATATASPVAQSFGSTAFGANGKPTQFQKIVVTVPGGRREEATTLPSPSPAASSAGASSSVACPDCGEVFQVSSMLMVMATLSRHQCKSGTKKIVTPRGGDQQPHAKVPASAPGAGSTEGDTPATEPKAAAPAVPTAGQSQLHHYPEFPMALSQQSMDPSMVHFTPAPGPFGGSKYVCMLCRAVMPQNVTELGAQHHITQQCPCCPATVVKQVLHGLANAVMYFTRVSTMHIMSCAYCGNEIAVNDSSASMRRAQHLLHCLRSPPSVKEQFSLMMGMHQRPGMGMGQPSLNSSTLTMPTSGQPMNRQAIMAGMGVPQQSMGMSNMTTSFSGHQKRTAPATFTEHMTNRPVKRQRVLPGQ